MTHVLFHRSIRQVGPAPAEGDVLRHVAFWLMLATATVGGLWVIGESLADPGGWPGLALVSTWLAPMVLVSVLAWWRPATAEPVLGTVTAGFVGVSLWAAVWNDSWHELQQDHGPVLVVAALALSVPLAVLAFRGVRTGGVMLLTVGLVPVILGMIVRTGGAAAMGVVSPPIVVCGALFLLAAGRHPMPGS